MKIQLMILLVLVSTGFAWSGSTSIDKDGMSLIDGQRCFILGLYEKAATKEFADEIAQTGFNLLRTDASKEALDLAHDHGLNAWIAVGGLEVSNDEQEKNLTAAIDALKDHPALAVWEGPDEALWNVWWGRWNNASQRWREVEDAVKQYQGTPEQDKQIRDLYNRWRRCQQKARYAESEKAEEEIRALVGMKPAEEKLSEWRQHNDPLYERLSRGVQTIRKADSNHVIWFNHAPRNTMADLTRFGQLADIVGCDIYPVPFGPDTGHSDLAERNLCSVGQYTRRMAESAPGKPVWMVLQGFGWNDLSKSETLPERPRPTYEQSRFMAYDAIVNGAKGILYWGTHAVEKDSNFWMELKALVSELRDVQPFLSAPDTVNQIKLELHPSPASDEKGMRLLVKQAGDRYALILVNESDSALAFDITGLESMNGKTAAIQGDTETIPVENGRVTYGLGARSAAVLLVQ